MPHTNALNLLVFPSMSLRHIAKGRERGGLRVLSEDDIWETAFLGVWTELLNARIASGFIQAHRIAAQAIKAGGDNKILGIGGTPHVGVRKDFHHTDDALVRKDSKIFPAPSKELYLKSKTLIESFHLFHIVMNLLIVSNERVF
jgi:hypothetical protein